MQITQEDIEARYTALQPDQKLCAHEIRGKAFRIVEENGAVGVMVRIVGHDSNNTVIALDIMCDPDTAVQFLGVGLDAVPTMAAYDVNGDSLEKLAAVMFMGTPE
jgi:hypothetical protein